MITIYSDINLFCKSSDFQMCYTCMQCSIQIFNILHAVLYERDAIDRYFLLSFLFLSFLYLIRILEKNVKTTVTIYKVFLYHFGFNNILSTKHFKRLFEYPQRNK